MTAALLSTGSPRARRAAFFLVILFAMAGTAVLAALGAAHQEEFGHDLGIFLDGAWRVLQGQRPHVDFHTPLGPVTLLLVAFAMKLTSLTANVMGFTVAVLFPVLTIWAWYLASRRMPAPSALLFSLFVGGCTASMFPFGYAFVDSSYAGLYNRIGYALLALALIELFLPRMEGSGRIGSLLDGFSTGIVAAALFFLKINFFVVVCVALVAGLRLLKRPPGWLHAFLAGLLLVALPMMIYLKFGFAALIADLYQGAAIRGASSGASKFFHVAVGGFGGIFFLFLIWLSYPGQARNGVASRAAAAGMAVFTWGGYLFLATTNMVMKEVPLYPVPAFILLEQARRANTVFDAEKAHHRYVVPFLVVLYLTARMLVPDIQGIANEVRWRTAQAGNPGIVRFQAERLAPVPVVWSAATCDTVPYGVKVNDGLGLLKRHVRPESRILVLDYTNLFSFALGQKSPRRDALWWHYGTTFDERNAWPPEDVFREVTIVMVPKCEEDYDTVAALSTLYGPYISRNYQVAEESQLWRLLERKMHNRPNGN